MQNPTLLADLVSSYPLVPMQHGMLFNTLLKPELGIDLTHIVYELPERIEPDLLQHAWQTCIDRHDIFRTSFAWEGLETPQQQVHKTAVFPFQFLDWATHPPQQQTEQYTTLLRQDRQKSFDFNNPPLMRGTLIQLAPKQFRFIGPSTTPSSTDAPAPSFSTKPSAATTLCVTMSHFTPTHPFAINNMLTGSMAKIGTRLSNFGAPAFQGSSKPRRCPTTPLGNQMPSPATTPLSKNFTYLRQQQPSCTASPSTRSYRAHGGCCFTITTAATTSYLAPCAPAAAAPLLAPKTSSGS